MLFESDLQLAIIQSENQVQLMKDQREFYQLQIDKATNIGAIEILKHRIADLNVRIEGREQEIHDATKLINPKID